ncbi:V-type ATPase [Cystobasidium minutum MCA 4210]|uniref:V-type ATPase n=1 Tax=Cystobasidium minutum MCA 4210 TaxID=1397322 RepID=UPI0034CDB9ED|eukprot:jgi/Rhomi1/157725/estExt_Genewise1Plus.C_2_t10327
MAANTAGIQTLLDAEKEAAKIVAKAREYRTQRVKDARGEAAKEIEAYKSKQEAEFQAFEKEHTGDNDALAAELDKQTDSQLDDIRAQFGRNKQSVVDKLLERVIDVEPSLHRNYKKPS